MSDICPECKSDNYHESVGCGNCGHNAIENILADAKWSNMDTIPSTQPQSELDALRADNAHLRALLRDVLASADSTEVNQIDYIVGSKAINAVREALGDE